MSSMKDFVIQRRYTGGTVLNFLELRLITTGYRSLFLALVHSLRRLRETLLAFYYHAQTHNPLVHGSNLCGPTILKAEHCAAFVFLMRSSQIQSCSGLIPDTHSGENIAR